MSFLSFGPSGRADGAAGATRWSLIAAVAIAWVRGGLKSRLVAHGGHGAEKKAKMI